MREDYIALCHAFPEQIIAVYNPVISEEFWKHAETEPQHPWLEDNREFKVIVSAGRLCEAKNHTLMLEAMRRLKEQGDYRLILLGSGELREKLVEQAQRSDIDRIVDFAGFVQNPGRLFPKSGCCSIIFPV